MSASGGTPPYTYNCYGSIPGMGLGLSNNVWTVIGSPSSTGSYNLSFTVTDSATPPATVSKTMVFVVSGGTSSVIPVPTSQQGFTYSPIDVPVKSTDPAQAKPIGIGSVANDGDNLSLQIGFNQFSGPVDIYLGIFIKSIDSNIWLIKSDLNLQPLSSGLVKWKENVTGPIDENLYGYIPVNNLPYGTYHLLLAVAPTGSLSSFYLWETKFVLTSASHMALGLETQGEGIQQYTQLVSQGDENALQKTVDFLKTFSNVEDAAIGDDGVSIWIQYDSGIEGIFVTKSFVSFSGIASAQYQTLSIPFDHKENNNSFSLQTTDANRKALILIPITYNNVASAL